MLTILSLLYIMFKGEGPSRDLLRADNVKFRGGPLCPLTTLIYVSLVPGAKLTNTMTPAEIRTQLLAPSFPVEKMTALLDHDNLEMRAEFRKFISEPVMVPRYNISLEEERELALRRLQRICDNKERLQQTNPTLILILERNSLLVHCHCDLQESADC